MRAQLVPNGARGGCGRTARAAGRAQQLCASNVLIVDAAATVGVGALRNLLGALENSSVPDVVGIARGGYAPGPRSPAAVAGAEASRGPE